MAELLVRVVDKVNPTDVYKDVKLSKRGDVIAVVPDGWEWTAAERANPEWRIFKLPAVTVDEANTLLEPEQDTRQVKVGIDPMLQRRGSKFDLDNAGLPAALRAYIADDKRQSAAFTIPAQITLASLKVQKPKRKDPRVIG